MAAHPSLILNRHRALKLNTKLGKDVSTSPYKSKYMALKKKVLFLYLYGLFYFARGIFFLGGGYFTFLHTFCNFRCVHYFWLPYNL